MYIINISSDTIPSTIVKWNDEYSHVNMNVRQLDDSTYIYDCIEKVPTPINITNIVKTAISYKFSKNELDYINTNSFNIEDTKVKEYNNFVKQIYENAQQIGF